MFDQSKKRIGFCCKYLEEDQTQPKKVLLENPDLLDELEEKIMDTLKALN